MCNHENKDMQVIGTGMLGSGLSGIISILREDTSLKQLLKDQGIGFAVFAGGRLLYEVSSALIKWLSNSDTNEKTEFDKYVGSTTWGYDNRNRNFGPNTWKCNQFVQDVIYYVTGKNIKIGNSGNPTTWDFLNKNINIPNLSRLNSLAEIKNNQVYVICRANLGHDSNHVGVLMNGVVYHATRVS